VDKPVEKVDNSGPYRHKTAILGIYAKQPIPGQCKTRLSPPLSPREAAELYRCSLLETVKRMRDHRNFDLAICYAGDRSWFEKTFPGVMLVPQRGPDLGARMATSLHGFLRQDYQQVVLIGSDAPDLPLSLIEQAFAALQNVDVVLAPAADGGYVLIGEANHRPELFEAIEWSTGAVLGETLQRIERHGITAVQLDSWEDLDDLPSLRSLLRRSPDSCTAEHLRQHLGRLFQP
jgi:rSAM/selenodomain-associated transferase 1